MNQSDGKGGNIILTQQVQPDDAAPGDGDITFRAGDGLNGMPGGSVMFQLGDGTEMLRLDPDGTFAVKGECIERDSDVYRAFKVWLFQKKGPFEHSAEHRENSAEKRANFAEQLLTALYRAAHDGEPLDAWSHVTSILDANRYAIIEMFRHHEAGYTPERGLL